MGGLAGTEMTGCWWGGGGGGNRQGQKSQDVGWTDWGWLGWGVTDRDRNHRMWAGQGGGGGGGV